jgi:hypothetical protein
MDTVQYKLYATDALGIQGLSCPVLSCENGLLTSRSYNIRLWFVTEYTTHNILYARVYARVDRDDDQSLI